MEAVSVFGLVCTKVMMAPGFGGTDVTRASPREGEPARSAKVFFGTRLSSQALRR